MITGNPSVFAIEASIAQAYANPGQLALGSFTIHVGGKAYGVRSATATLLACSFDSVERRVARQGTHAAPFAEEPHADRIASSVLAAIYGDERQGEQFFGLSNDSFKDLLISNEIIWAPDGDAAFDDGSHVLQFDVDNQVRLIAFKNLARQADIAATISDVWLPAGEFYGILKGWKELFRSQRAEALKNQTTH